MKSLGNMIILPLQYDKHSGPDAVGSHRITFSMDESVTTSFNPMKIKKGTQFIVILLEDEFEQQEFAQEKPEDTKMRFKKRMEALITEKGLDREQFKTELKELGLIKNSTTELDLAGYAKVIALLQ